MDDVSVPADLAAQLRDLNPGSCDSKRTRFYLGDGVTSTVESPCCNRATHTLFVTCTDHGTHEAKALCELHASTVRVTGGPWKSDCGGQVTVDLRRLACPPVRSVS